MTTDLLQTLMWCLRGAVIDKYNFLWIGSGNFMHDGRTNSVLRIDTTNAMKPRRVFAISHRTKV